MFYGWSRSPSTRGPNTKQPLFDSLERADMSPRIVGKGISKTRVEKNNIFAHLTQQIWPNHLGKIVLSATCYMIASRSSRAN